MDRWLCDDTGGPITERLHGHITMGWTSHNPGSGSEYLQFVSPHARPVLARCDQLFGDIVNKVVDKVEPISQQSHQSTSFLGNTLPTNHDGTVMAKQTHDQSVKSDGDSLPALDSSIGSRTEESVSTGYIRTENMRQTALAQAGPPTDPAIYMQCPFYFLNCSMHFTDCLEWKGHCNSHLKRASPPTTMNCAHCQTTASWNDHLTHLWREHKGYHNLAAVPFDKRLLMTLLKKRIIEVSKYQILLNDGKLETCKGAPLALMHNPAQERRRRDGKDRPRESRPHVARPFEPQIVDHDR
ncbi:hypothetical protein BDZ85DRAFT_278087 [Elsinoe ampelina]|uniref:Uncharacterized protein n=1 Tax=Elsinoe ampelina TaxID=302913 RepID=A0A6A6GSB2_9PEZI|nr:hypothetical protein BDZ85DRAFT_278087 [Elsinoe ampelina]